MFLLFCCYCGCFVAVSFVVVSVVIFGFCCCCCLLFPLLLLLLRGFSAFAAAYEFGTAFVVAVVCVVVGAGPTALFSTKTASTIVADHKMCSL